MILKKVSSALKVQVTNPLTHLHPIIYLLFGIRNPTLLNTSSKKKKPLSKAESTIWFTIWSNPPGANSGGGLVIPCDLGPLTKIDL